MELYRYVVQYKSYDYDTDVVLLKFEVVRETEKSYCIRPYGKDKWTRKDAYNAFAHKSEADAMEHFKRRTAKRVGWFKFWIEQCESALEIAKSMPTHKGHSKEDSVS